MKATNTTNTATATTTTTKYPWSHKGLYDNPATGYTAPQCATLPGGKLEYQLPWESAADFERRIAELWEEFGDNLDHWQA